MPQATAKKPTIISQSAALDDSIISVVLTSGHLAGAGINQVYLLAGRALHGLEIFERWRLVGGPSVNLHTGCRTSEEKCAHIH